MHQQKFIAKQVTQDYRPSVVGMGSRRWDHRGLFGYYDVEDMRRDGQVQFGLRILYAPLTQVKWQVKAKSAEVKDLVESTFKKVWGNHLQILFKALSYGWSGGEIIYKETSEGTRFETIADVHPFDLRPLHRGRELLGVSVRGAKDGDGKAGWILTPRSLWVAYDAENGSHFGRSRLSQAWYPWQEKTARHGAIDVRRLWFLKNVFRGGMMRHPLGTIETSTGVYQSCQDYAREIVEKFETGGVMTLPNVTDDRGEQLWQWEDPVVNGDLTGVREYTGDLDTEILVHMGIPSEVVQAAESGSGWAGRSVPFLVFLAGEDEIVKQLYRPVREQILKPLVWKNFGEEAAEGFEIEFESLVPPSVDGQAKEQEGKPAGPAGGADLGMLLKQQPQPQQEQLSLDTVRLAAALGEYGESPWVAYVGKRGARKGQTGWKHSTTGRVVWGVKPTRRSPHAAQPGSRPTAQHIKEHLEKVRASGKAPTADQIKDLADSLMHMSVKDLQGLKKELGLKASGVKVELVRKIQERALAKPATPTSSGAQAKQPAAPDQMPTDKDLSDAKWESLGNKSGNVTLLKTKIGDKEFVLKPSQMGKAGSDREKTLSDLARKIGLNSPRFSRLSSPPDIPDGVSMKGMRFADDAWSVAEMVPGRPIEEADLQKEDIASHVVKDALFAWIAGHEDRNEGNLLVDDSGKVSSIDWDSEPDDAVKFGKGLGILPGMPTGTPIPPETVQKVLSVGDEVASVVGGKARERLDALRKLAGRDNLTVGEAAKSLGGQQEPPAPVGPTHTHGSVANAALAAGAPRSDVQDVIKATTPGDKLKALARLDSHFLDRLTDEGVVTHNEVLRSALRAHESGIAEKMALAAQRGAQYAAEARKAGHAKVADFYEQHAVPFIRQMAEEMGGQRNSAPAPRPKVMDLPPHSEAASSAAKEIDDVIDTLRSGAAWHDQAVAERIERITQAMKKEPRVAKAVAAHFGLSPSDVTSNGVLGRELTKKSADKSYARAAAPPESFRVPRNPAEQIDADIRGMHGDDPHRVRGGSRSLPDTHTRENSPWVIGRLRDAHSKYIDDMPDNQKKAIQDYTLYSFHELNQRMRKGQKLNAEQREMVSQLSDATANAPPIDEHVYRGMSMSKQARGKFLASMKAALASGDPIESKSFASTTAAPGKMAGFMEPEDPSHVPIGLEIHARKGLYVQPGSRVDSEHEVLLPPGKFRVVGLKEVPIKGENGVVKHQVVQLEQV